MIEELFDAFEGTDVPEDMPNDLDTDFPALNTPFLEEIAPTYTESFVNTENFVSLQPTVEIEDYVNTNFINENTDTFESLHNSHEITPFNLQTDNLQVDNSPLTVDNTPLSIQGHPSFTGDSFYEDKVSGAYKSMVDNVNDMRNALKHDNLRNANYYAEKAGDASDSLKYWEEAKFKNDYREAMWDFASIDRVEQIYKKQ